MGIGEPPQVELDRGNTKSPSHKSADLQFARFLEAAERLGSSLDRNFDDLFVSIVLYRVPLIRTGAPNGAIRWT